MKTNQTLAIRFKLRADRTKDGKAPIYVSITVNKRKSDIALKQSIKPDDWHILKGFAKPRTPDLKSLNYYLESVKSQILQYYQELQIQKKLVTAEVLKNLFLGIKEEQQYTLCNIIKYHNDNMQLTLAKGTTKNYYTTEKYLKEFLTKHHKTSDIYLRELNYQFIIEFEMFLRRHAPAQGWKKLENNGTMKHLERLRKMVNLAVKLGWIDKSPFVQYQLKFQKKERGYLSKEELTLIENVELSLPTLSIVRDLFVFSCYTGLAYIDLMQLEQQQVSIGIDGNYWIKTLRQKTDTLSTIPLLSKAKTILKKYASSNEIPTARIFPTLTNQAMNANLKILGQLCHISKVLTFHLARHTFATTVTLTNGVPIETVSKMLGHTKISTTQIYAKVLERKISADMMMLEQKLLNS